MKSRLCKLASFQRLVTMRGVHSCVPTHVDFSCSPPALRRNNSIVGLFGRRMNGWKLFVSVCVCVCFNVQFDTFCSADTHTCATPTLMCREIFLIFVCHNMDLVSFSAPEFAHLYYITLQFCSCVHATSYALRLDDMVFVCEHTRTCRESFVRILCVHSTKSCRKSSALPPSHTLLHTFTTIIYVMAKCAAHVQGGTCVFHRQLSKKQSCNVIKVKWKSWCTLTDEFSYASHPSIQPTHPYPLSSILYPLSVRRNEIHRLNHLWVGLLNLEIRYSQHANCLWILMLFCCSY